MQKQLLSVLLLCALLLGLAGCAGASHGAGETYAVQQYRTTMQYYEDFKILQIADLHLGIETDVALQQQILRDTNRREQPDLIVLTGDNFMYASKGVVKSLISTLNEECAALTTARNGRLTKFTLTFGNHDNQGDYARYYINDVIRTYVTADGNEITDRKFAAFVDYEDDSLFGLANFYIDLVDDRTKSTDTVDVKYRVHIIDSNTYHFMGPDYDYDIIHDDQLNHAINIKNNATTDKDYVGLAFFHIPLTEYQEAWEQFQNGGGGQGECNEDALHGYKNNGAYDKLKEAGIISFFCGHDHINYGDFIYTDKNGDYVVHFMPINATANYHPTVRLHKIGNPIVQSLDYEPLQGKVEITGKITGARLYSADLDEVRACKVTNGTAEVELEGLRRFFSVKLEK